jgi:IS5 family transposase
MGVEKRAERTAQKEGGAAMLVDRYPVEEVFARVPELAARADPVLRQLERLLEDEPLFALVRADLARRYPKTASRGRHSTPVEVILRLLVVQHLDNWSLRETEERVADSLVLGWCCRVYCHPVPAASTLWRWASTIQPATLTALLDRVGRVGPPGQGDHGPQAAAGRDGGADHLPPPHRLQPADGWGARAQPGAPPHQAAGGERLAGVRDACRTRLRTMRRGLQALHRLARRRGEEAAEARTEISWKLVETESETVRQAQRVRGRSRRRGGWPGNWTAWRPWCGGRSARPSGGCWRASRCRRARRS